MTRETLVIETGGGKRSFDVEVARTSQERSRGLMFRAGLAVGHGMLFPYAKPDVVTMWMRNTYISLDMIFIAADGRVERIEARTQPLSDGIISSGGAVTGVLEIGAGEAGRLGIKAGDLVRHAHFGTAVAKP